MPHKSSIPLSKRTQKTRYRLIATQCKNCNEIFIPPRNFCPKCRRKGIINEIELSGKGEVYSFTIMKTAPEGFEENIPYVIGIIKLDEGPLFSSQIVKPYDNLAIGSKVKPVFRRINKSKTGFINYGIKFELV